MARVSDGACRLPGRNRRYSKISDARVTLKIMATTQASMQRLKSDAEKAELQAAAAKQRLRAAKAVLKRTRKLYKAEKKAAKQARKKFAAARTLALTRAPTRSLP